MITETAAAWRLCPAPARAYPPSAPTTIWWPCARCNHIQPNFLGLANTVDGLVAVNRLVYESGEYDMPRLLEILDGNFEKEPSLRARIIHRFPHFGTNESEIDALMK